MQGATPPAHALVEDWLRDLSLAPSERAERDGVVSWDFVLDGRRRTGIRLTVIFDPSLALIVWLQFAPPINDAFRKSYRKLLRWNDELPFAKFAISEDERPILTTELEVSRLDRDKLGLAIARLLAICDRLVDDSKDWLAMGPRSVRPHEGTEAGVALLDRYAGQIRELVETETGASRTATGAESDRAREPTEPAGPVHDRVSPP